MLYKLGLVVSSKQKTIKLIYTKFLNICFPKNVNQNKKHVPRCQVVWLARKKLYKRDKNKTFIWAVEFTGLILLLLWLRFIWFGTCLLHHNKLCIITANTLVTNTPAARQPVAGGEFHFLALALESWSFIDKVIRILWFLSQIKKYDLNFSIRTDFLHDCRWNAWRVSWTT